MWKEWNHTIAKLILAREINDCRVSNIRGKLTSGYIGVFFVRVVLFYMSNYKESYKERYNNIHMIANVSAGYFSSQNTQSSLILFLHL